MTDRSSALGAPWRGVALDASSGVPIWVQLKTQFEYAIATGTVPDHTPLPSVRALSKELGVAIDTVRKAYDALTKAGLIETIRGTGTFTRLPDGSSAAATTDHHGWAESDETLVRLLTASPSPATAQRALGQRLAMLEHGLSVGFVGVQASAHRYAAHLDAALPEGIPAVVPISVEQLRGGDLRPCDGLTHLVTLMFHTSELEALLSRRPVRILPLMSVLSPAALAEIEQLAGQPMILVARRETAPIYLDMIGQALITSSSTDLTLPEFVPDDEPDQLHDRLQPDSVVLHTSAANDVVEPLLSSGARRIELVHEPREKSLHNTVEIIRSDLESLLELQRRITGGHH